MSNTVDLRRIALLFERGAIHPGIRDTLKTFDGEMEFDFEKFDENFEKLIEQEEWDINDSIRLSALFFARAVEMSYMESEPEDDSEADET